MPVLIWNSLGVHLPIGHLIRFAIEKEGFVFQENEQAASTDLKTPSKATKAEDNKEWRMVRVPIDTGIVK